MLVYTETLIIMQDSKSSAVNGNADIHDLAFEGEKRVQYDRLVELREQILDELRVLSDNSLTSNKQAGEELADIGSDNFLRDMELSLLSEEGRKIRLIDDAIRRLQNDTYGKCIDCNKMISDGRLEALPYARLCVKCKSAREQAERG